MIFFKIYIYIQADLAAQVLVTMHLNRELRRLGEFSQRIMGEEDDSVFDGDGGQALLGEVAALASKHARG